MTPKTIQTLSKLNKHFYEVSGSKWNPKPNYYWEGWLELIKYLDLIGSDKVIRVLDIGCGNGRFSNFLVEYLSAGIPRHIEYIGIDYAVPMLDQITDRSGLFLDSPTHTITRSFFEIDLVENQALEIGIFDLVVAFGVIHHIPSNQLREEVINSWSKYLKPSGLFVLTTWDYLDVPRLAKHCLANEQFITQAIYHGLGIDMSQMESGDNLLRWVKYMPEGQYTLRYSHYFQDSEIEEILKTANLELITKYQMDGGLEKRNGYYVGKRQ